MANTADTRQGVNMGKLTLDALRKLRDENKQTLSLRDSDNKSIQMVVGMGTCGIAAGAKDTFGMIVDLVAEKGLSNVLVRQTGCMGLCHSEPTVEVTVPGMPSVIYGNVNPTVAREIIEKHVLGHHLLDDHICDKPAIDIVK